MAVRVQILANPGFAGLRAAGIRQAAAKLQEQGQQHGNLRESDRPWPQAQRMVLTFLEGRNLRCARSPPSDNGARVPGRNRVSVELLLLLVRPGNLELHRGDFLQISYHGAGLVVCYLFPRGMQQLRARFEDELPAGAVVISNTFPVPGWRAVRTLWPESDPHYPIHVYRVPDAFAGDAAPRARSPGPVTV